MYSLDLNNEWKKLKHELRNNKLKKTPYSDYETYARENLLKAQILLSEYENEKLKSKKEKLLKHYQSLIERYYQLVSNKN